LHEAAGLINLNGLYVRIVALTERAARVIRLEGVIRWD
jgi:hypothetical protein